MTFTAFPRPYGSLDPAVLVLYQMGQDDQTGLTTTALTLSNEPIDGTLLLFKNGVQLNTGAGAGEYQRTGTAVTLGAAAIAGDRFLAQYHFRSTRNG